MKMSAEKERRYQELYKNRFVNPIDQGVGRRTGWVLNKEVRKDSEGFELFDDYWSDSGDESVDDLSLHANKENNGKRYKLSSPIMHMPDFTPSSRGSTDVEPLSDVGSKTVTSNSTITKASNNASMVVESVKTKRGNTKDDSLPAETENDVASRDDATTVDTATPNRGEGGIQESDITGSIIKGGNSFQAMNSALQGFKTKTRLSFGVDVDETPRRRSTQRKSSREAEKPGLSDKGSASDTTIIVAQSDMESEGHITAQEELIIDTGIPPTAKEQRTSSQEELRTSVVMQNSLPEMEEKTSLVTEETFRSILEKTSDKEQGDAVADDKSTKDNPDKEMTVTEDSKAMQQKSAGKNTNRKTSAPQKQPTTNSHEQSGAATKPARRKRRNVTHMEEDILMSGEEGMFISLQKSFVSRQDGTKEMVSDKSVLSDQSFQDANDEEIVDIIDDECSYYKSNLRTKSKSRETAKTSARKLVANKKGQSLSKTRRPGGRTKKADKQEESKQDFVDLIFEEEVPSPTKKKAEPVRGRQSVKSVSIEKSRPDVKKSRLVQRPKLLRSRKSGRASGSNSQYEARSSSDAGEESGRAGSDVDAKKGNRSRRRSSKKVEQNLPVAAGSDETGSTETDEDQGRRKSRRKKSQTVAADRLGEENTKGDAASTKSSRTRGRSVMGGRNSHSLHAQNKNVEEAETEPLADFNNVGEIDHEGAPSDITGHKQIHSTTNPATASLSKSARKKRVSVHFSSVEVISDDVPTPMDDGEKDAESTPNPVGFLSPSSHQTSLDGENDVNSSPKKKFKGTPGVKLIPRYPSSRRSPGNEEMSKDTAEKRTVETSREDVTDNITETKRQRGSSSSVRGGRKRGGKRKLYSGDLPSSFLNDPSGVDPPFAAGVTNTDPSMTSDLEASSAIQSQPGSRGAVVKRVAPVRGRGRDRRRARGRGSARKTPTSRDSTREIQEPDNVVLDFLTKYESGKESESTDSEDGSNSMGPAETSQSEVDGASSSVASTPGGMYTTVYPEPTPQSILKGSASGSGIDAKKKNLTLQFFEVPRPKAFIVAPDEAANGQRRTKRNRVRPVEFWRNERPKYQRRKSGGFVLVGVQSPTVSSPDSQTQRGATQGKGKRKPPQTPVNLSMHVSPPPGGKVAEHPAMVVINPDTQEEVEVDTLRTSKMNTFVGPSGKEATADDPITLCKSIMQKAFSSGILTIRPLSEKGMQFVQNDSMVFYITRGKLSVTIHHTTSILQNGDMFFVPQGNMYNIKNLRRDEAKLVFFQHKGR